MSKSVIPDIPSSHESLIKWAYEHNYSPVTSYTKAPVANRFHLQLEDTGKLEEGLLAYRKNVLYFQEYDDLKGAFSVLKLRFWGLLFHCSSSRMLVISMNAG